MSNFPRTGSILGYLSGSSGGATSSTFTLNAAGTWLAFSFIADRSASASKIKARISAKTGTLAQGDLSCGIYSDTNGAPGSLLEASTTVTTVPTGAIWVEFTGFTYSLTAGTRYWLIFKNLNATPASNYPTYTVPSASTGFVHWQVASDQANLWGWGRASTTNSGSTWSYVNCVGNYRIEYGTNPATYSGFPWQSVTGDSTNMVQGTKEVGNLFTTPANAVLNVIGAVFAIRASGTVTGNLQYKLYNGTTIIGTSMSMPPGNVPTGSYLLAPLFFSSPQIIYPNTALRLVMSETANSDTGSNYYYATVDTWENDANSLLLEPPYGMQETYYNGSSWAQTANVSCRCALLLDPSGEFGAISKTAWQRRA